jgi:hypothetical protein
VFSFRCEARGLLEDVGESDEFSALGLFHGADKSIGGWRLEYGDEVLDCGSEQVGAGQSGEWALWEPCELVDDADLSGVCGPDLVAAVVFK